MTCSVSRDTTQGSNGQLAYAIRSARGGKVSLLGEHPRVIHLFFDGPAPSLNPTVSLEVDPLLRCSRSPLENSNGWGILSRDRI
jgi:hypothetical protein